MNFKNALAAVAVDDIEAAVAWYKSLIGRPPDNRPMDGVASWQFREGGWLEVFEEKERAGKGTMIFAVVSLETQLEDLANRQVAFERIDHAQLGEIAVVWDPDGNRLVFAGPLTGVLDD